MTVIREPAVAGQFYPGNASELSATIRLFFEDIQAEPTPAPKALIVPHAGYVYSGPVAAAAYARLFRDNSLTDTAVAAPDMRFYRVVLIPLAVSPPVPRAGSGAGASDPTSVP